ISYTVSATFGFSDRSIFVLRRCFRWHPICSLTFTLCPSGIYGDKFTTKGTDLKSVPFLAREDAMKRQIWSVGGATLLGLALLGSSGVSQAQQTTTAPSTTPPAQGDIREDTQDIRQDRRDIREDRKE